jgi:hypothetical protein
VEEDIQKINSSHEAPSTTAVMVVQTEEITEAAVGEEEGDIEVIEEMIEVSIVAVADIVVDSVTAVVAEIGEDSEAVVVGDDMEELDIAVVDLAMVLIHQVVHQEISPLEHQPVRPDCIHNNSKITMAVEQTMSLWEEVVHRLDLFPQLNSSSNIVVVVVGMMTIDDDSTIKEVESEIIIIVIVNMMVLDEMEIVELVIVESMMM